jgi:dynein heavy chain
MYSFILYFRNLQDVLKALNKEVSSDFARAMNRLTFNCVVTGNPQQFPNIDVPVTPPMTVPEFGKAAPPAANMRKNKIQFSSSTFLNQPQVIVALEKLNVECSKVASMTLFNTKIIKCLKLEEFQLTQSQSYEAVQAYTKAPWVTECKKILLTSLSQIGKGWFNLAEKDQHVYEVSKLRSFMNLTKFIMQDALRTLVQVSL